MVQHSQETELSANVSRKLPCESHFQVLCKCADAEYYPLYLMTRVDTCLNTPQLTEKFTKKS